MDHIITLMKLKNKFSGSVNNEEINNKYNLFLLCL